VVRVVRRVPRGAWLTRRGHGCRQPRSRGADTRNDRSSGVDAGGFSASGTLCGEQRAPERSAGAEPCCGSLDGAGGTRGSGRASVSGPRRMPNSAPKQWRAVEGAASVNRRAGRRPLLPPADARCVRWARRRPLRTPSRPTRAVDGERVGIRCCRPAAGRPLEPDRRCTGSSRARLGRGRPSAAQIPASTIDGDAEAASASASGCAPQQAETASRLSLRGGHAHESGMRHGMRRCEAECS
jgi:hypothetical protein